MKIEVFWDDKLWWLINKAMAERTDCSFSICLSWVHNIY